MNFCQLSSEWLLTSRLGLPTPWSR